MYNKKSLSYAGIFLSLIGICSAIYYRMNLTGFVVLDSAVNSIGGFFPLLFVMIGVAFLILGGEKATLEDIAEEGSDGSTRNVLSFRKRRDIYIIHDDRNELGKGIEMALPVFTKGFKDLGNEEEREIVSEVYSPLLVEAVGRGGEIGREALKFLRVVDPENARKYEQRFRDEENEQKSRGENKSGERAEDYGLSKSEREDLQNIYKSFKGKMGPLSRKLQEYGFRFEEGRGKGDHLLFSDGRGNIITLPERIDDNSGIRSGYISSAIRTIEKSRREKAGIKN